MNVAPSHALSGVAISAVGVSIRPVGPDTVGSAETTEPKIATSVRAKTVIKKQISEIYNSALKIYENIHNNYNDHFLMPHTLFSIGRINEILENYEKAVNFYEELEENYSNSSWTTIAKNRIINMIAKGKYVEEKPYQAHFY